MLFAQASLVLALSFVVAAAPLEERWELPDRPEHPWTASPSYMGFSKRIASTDTNAATCNMASAVMPTAPTPLPAPATGLSLSHVAIGRGTQNYTCDLSNSTAVPVAIGALATLFNVTCIAANSPDLLEQLPGIALNLPVPTSDNVDEAAYQDMSGHHYFLDSSTPFFNMDTSLHNYGTGAFKKANSSSAPSNAILGQNGQGNGSVAWLKLDAKNSEGQVFQEVYRLNTAGGQPPQTCSGMPAAFEVQYAAEYWLFE